MDQQTTIRHLGEERNWPCYSPVFTLLAMFLAVAATLAAFAYQLKTKWSPLQKAYLKPYVSTAHLSVSRNVYLIPKHTFPLLTVVGLRRDWLATNSDVELTAISSALPGFKLSQSAAKVGARRLEWRYLRLDDQWLHSWLEQSIYNGQSLWQSTRQARYAGLLVLALILPLAIRQDIRQARKRREGRRLRGANVVSRAEFHRRNPGLSGIGWSTAGRPTFWELCNLTKPERKVIRVARETEAQHFLFVGDTGSGKSSVIRQLLLQVAERDETAIVYDPEGEYVTQFLDPERGDVVLNPLDVRMPYWSPADELCRREEAITLATSLFPDRDRENRFFVESPRKIFAHLLKYRPTPQQLAYWIAHADPEIDRRVAGTALAKYVAKDAPQQREGVLAVLEKAASALELLPSRERTTRQWSITEWAAKRQGWLFIVTTHETRETVRPLVSLWLDFLTLRLTAQSSSRQVLAPVWVVVDELPTLQTLPTLPLALAESRKSNTRMVLGFQGRSQLQLRYGREAEAMLSQPRTKIFFRTSEPEAAQWISKSIGEIEVEHLREGRSTRDYGLGSSKNATVDRRIEAAVLASEIQHLPDLEGYFQVPGYTLKVKFPYFAPVHNELSVIPAAGEDFFTSDKPDLEDAEPPFEEQTIGMTPPDPESEEHVSNWSQLPAQGAVGQTV
jgi:hypothetical protein